YFKGANMFDYMETYDKITFEYANKVFNEHFTADKLAMSVIKPA
ncbi:MAG: peptidase M16, partial [Clostridiaceae bacterium]|nr:peptidase M16 [Clostridiaceae bacterium]